MAFLARGMANEFNNILTTLMGACSLIDKDDSANGDLLRYVALIRASAEHAATLSERLMQAGMQGKKSARSRLSTPDFGAEETSGRDKKSNHDIVPLVN